MYRHSGSKEILKIICAFYLHSTDDHCGTYVPFGTFDHGWSDTDDHCDDSAHYDTGGHCDGVYAHYYGTDDHCGGVYDYYCGTDGHFGDTAFHSGSGDHGCTVVTNADAAVKLSAGWWY